MRAAGARRAALEVGFVGAAHRVHALEQIPALDVAIDRNFRAPLAHAVFAQRARLALHVFDARGLVATARGGLGAGAAACLGARTTSGRAVVSWSA